MTNPGRWPVILGCHGTEENPHDPVTWMGTRVAADESTNEPACWVCDNHPYSTSPKHPAWLSERSVLGLASAADSARRP